MNLTTTQEAAIKCAFVDLCASYQAWKDMDVYSHDWVAHSHSIDELMEAFPFLMETKKDLNINIHDEEEETTFKLVNCKGGSSLKGYIKTTYQELVSAFGKPNHDGDGGYKVGFEWAIQFSDGTYATIYDWKLSLAERDEVILGKPYEFHIGGFNIEAVNRVHEQLKLVATT